MRGKTQWLPRFIYREARHQPRAEVERELKALPSYKACKRRTGTLKAFMERADYESKLWRRERERQWDLCANVFGNSQEEQARAVTLHRE